MIFIAESASIFYDAQQDRLKLLFRNKEGKQLLGIMTRQMFKGLLVQLPEWLANQSFKISEQQTQTPELQSKTSERQHTVSQFEHQLAQQQVEVTSGTVKLDPKCRGFLTQKINFVKKELIGDDQNSKNQVRMIFISTGKTKEAVLTLNTAQLHKLIGEMLKKVVEWDLSNPWQDEGYANVVPNQTSGIMH